MHGFPILHFFFGGGEDQVSFPSNKKSAQTFLKKQNRGGEGRPHSDEYMSPMLCGRSHHQRPPKFIFSFSLSHPPCPSSSSSVFLPSIPLTSCQPLPPPPLPLLPYTVYTDRPTKSLRKVEDSPGGKEEEERPTIQHTHQFPHSFHLLLACPSKNFVRVLS